MIQIQLPSGCYLLVEVPEKSSGFEIEPRWGMLLFYTSTPSFQNMSDRELPEGQWSIIGKVDELKGEGWVYIVGENNMKPETTLILRQC